jgi:hypothetical protein
MIKPERLNPVHFPVCASYALCIKYHIASLLLPNSISLCQYNYNADAKTALKKEK